MQQPAIPKVIKTQHKLPPTTATDFSPAAVFKSIDVDQSNTIDVDELALALTATLGRSLKSKQVSNL